MSRPRIGVCAEAFGFGPASKAASIVAGLRTEREIDVVPLATSIAHEFLVREGISGLDPIDVHTPEGVRAGREAARDLDLAIIVLLPEWLPVIPPGVPVVYVDSLGFLWPSAYFEEHPKLRTVAAYVVQDVFGSADRLRGFGVENVKAVGALLPVLPSPAAERDGMLIHMGGLLNIFSAEDGPRYAQFMSQLLHGLVYRSTPALMSQTLRDRLQLDDPAFVPTTLPHAETLKAFSKATSVLGSTGMTSLLELTALETPLVPLPPQNLSQARIIRGMADREGLPEVWKFLAEAYEVPEDVPEEEGVARVRSLNGEYARSTTFQQAYRDVARSAIETPPPLPDILVKDFDGIKDTVRVLRRLLDR